MATPTSFLALSGEIRNQIYDYILEDISATPAPKYTLRHLPRSRSRKFEAHRQFSRPYLGFTQVCRLIRLEFKPLYIWHKPTVPFLDAPAYLEQYPLSDDHKSQQITKILRDLGKPVKMDDPSLIDILPLIRYGISNLPFSLTHLSDIAKSPSHNRKRIVNYALNCAIVAEHKYQDQSYSNKVIEIGLRQRGRAQKVAPTVEVIVTLDGRALDKLEELDVEIFASRLLPHYSLYCSVSAKIMVGSVTYDRYLNKRERGREWSTRVW